MILQMRVKMALSDKVVAVNKLINLLRRFFDSIFSVSIVFRLDLFDLSYRLISCSRKMLSSDMKKGQIDAEEWGGNFTRKFVSESFCAIWQIGGKVDKKKV